MNLNLVKLLIVMVIKKKIGKISESVSEKEFESWNMNFELREKMIAD